MSANSLALTTVRNWGPGNEFRPSSSPDDDPHQSRRSSIPRPIHYLEEENEGMHAPWRLFEERVRSGPFSLTRFPSHPQSPSRILIMEVGMEGRANPRLVQFIRDSPPRIRSDWHLQPQHETQESGVSSKEFKKAMKKIKKQVYNPPYPQRVVKKRGLFSNWKGSNSISSMNTHTNNNADDEEKDESKQCAVCLEVFTALEQVLVTPCNHMFHEECLVPWVKSHGQCPVCRFAFCERRGAPLPNNFDSSSSNRVYNNTGEVGESNLAVDLITLIRAMEEAFNWTTLSG